MFENYITTVEVEGQLHNMGLWDTAGQEDYDRLRPISYLSGHKDVPNTDVFLLVFPIGSPSGFENAEEKVLMKIFRKISICVFPS